MKLLVLVLWAYLAVWPAGAQDAANFERFDMDDGLPSNWILSILQDRQGFMWFGTIEGLSRYDGHEFRTFRNQPAEPSSLSDDAVWVLLEDRKGAMWVGTGGGLNRYEPATESFIRFGADPSRGDVVPQGTVTALVEDREGIIWVGTSQGLLHLDPSSGAFQQFDVGNDRISNHVTALAEDAGSILWVGTQGGGLFRFDRSTGEFMSFRHDPTRAGTLRSDRVTALLVDSGGTLWVATEPPEVTPQSQGSQQASVVHRFDRASDTFHPVVYRTEEVSGLNYTPTALLQTRDGALWIGTRNAIGGDAQRSGIHHFDPQSGIFTTFGYNPTDPRSLSWLFVMGLYEDRSGALWVGTSRGLNRWDRGQRLFGRFKVHTEDPFHLVDNIYGLHEDEHGVLWLGSSGFGLTRYDRSTNDIRRYAPDRSAEHGLRSGPILSIARDRQGMLWMANNSGLQRFDRSSGWFHAFRHEPGNPNSLPDNMVSTIFIDGEDVVWAGTAYGLARLDRATGTFRTYRHSPEDSTSLVGNLISVITSDREGYLWIGTNRTRNFASQTGPAGLSRLDPRTGRSQNFRHDPGNPHTLSNNGINAILEDRTGVIWVGTNSALNRYDAATGRFKHYGVEHGLSSATIAALLEDESGHLWISTEGGGLVRFDPITETFRSFDLPHGIQNRRFNRGAAFKSASGELFFGGVSGINFFRPDTLSITGTAPTVVLTGFNRRDRRVYFDRPLWEINQVVLPYSENTFSFEFAALSFQASERNRYAYRLDGFDTDWVHSGDRRYANYTNLPPGRYVFRVKAANSEGIWNEEGVSMAIRILPPWWRTWWAYTIYVVLLIAAMLTAYIHQRRKLLAREYEKARERELEHGREMERAYRDLKRTQAQLVQQEKLASLGALTAGIAHEIKNPLNFINNFSQLTAEMAEELIDVQRREPATPLGEVNDVLEDIRLNSTKILEHGVRADSIVKSMLQHSRGGVHRAEPTEVNGLVEEYVGLAYHGRRAQQADFAAEIALELDPAAGQVELVAQDIGRVVLNLVGNAFDAVTERRAEEGRDYVPRVRVTTRRTGAGVEVSVEDNGTGIPASVREKVFEPFFTTKAAGKGTGLGLSMSHEIVVSGHGGRLGVEDVVGGGTRFVFFLPAAALTALTVQHTS
jgi:ligand-binding sensor domain-containing protein/signal transduction histidine kinase